MIQDLVLRNRSYRRFRQEVAVDLATLRDLVDLGRLSASGRNLQPLRYVLSNDPETNAAIFECLAWAGYLKDWAGPAEGERPAGYIVVVGVKAHSEYFAIDEGLAIQSILLGAVERGLGGCIIGSVQRERLRGILAIPERYDILHVIALGVPGETVVVEDLAPDGDVKYWRDADSVHHVPKRRLGDIILDERSPQAKPVHG